MFSSNTSQVSATSTQAEAIDFDGTNDYLSRASDLTGNADGKTFTFSFWMWNPVDQGAVYCAGSSRFIVQANTNNVTIVGQNAAGTTILSLGGNTLFAANTWNHILVSVDLANTSNRSVYINDVLITPTWPTYTNDTIDFTQTAHSVAGRTDGAVLLKARLSNVFLDYTYRDLSITANRRLFVTADLKPAAGQAALNPIMYLPLSDPTAPGLNQGTGGNFTSVGTVARSGRGPNQYNAPYSTFDGTGTRLQRYNSPMTGLADGTSFTLSFVVGYTTGGTVLSFASGATERFYVVISSNTIGIWGFNPSGTQVLRGNVNTPLVPSRNYQISISIDLSNTAKRHVYINGVSSTVNWITYDTAGVIDFAPTTPNFQVGDGYNFLYLGSRLGELWFNTNYTDLSVAANLKKFVDGTRINAKPVDLGVNGELPTGTSPLIYLPLYGNNAGKNYGTGGDFPSATFPGARGPNEFWGNLLNPGDDGSGGGGAGIGGLRRLSSLTGAADSKTFSFSFWTRITASFSNFFTLTTSGGELISAFMDNSSYINLRFRTSDGVLNSLNQNTAALNTNVLNQIFGCVDTNGVCRLFVNGVQVRQLTFSSNLDILFGSINGNAVPGTTTAFGRNRVGEFYFTTDYIDFSQEANRLKFRDAFGNPVDLTQQIEAAAIPNPAIYLRFDPASFGTNLGTGGAFTPSGTILDGGQF